MKVYGQDYSAILLDAGPDKVRALREANAAFRVAARMWPPIRGSGSSRQRHAKIGSAEAAAHAPIWVGIRGMRREIGKNGKPKKTQATIQAPLKSYAWFENRGGEVANTIQLIERGADRGRPGELVIGVVSDMEKPSPQRCSIKSFEVSGFGQYPD